MASRDTLEYARALTERAVHDKRQMAIDRRSSSPSRAVAGSGAAAHGADPAAALAGLLASGSEGAKGPPTPDAVCITLNHGEHQDSTIYCVEKGTRLQFVPGVSLLGRKVVLYTNYVTDAGDDSDSVFVRAQYTALPWRRLTGEGAGAGGGAGGAGGGVELLPAAHTITDTDTYCELTPERAGPYHFYFIYDDNGSEVGPAGSCWVQVPPTLATRVPPAGLCCQTVLTKCLGPFQRWESVLRVAKESGYNMIHFTPVQELGGSESCYSLRDQLRLDPRYGATTADLDNLLQKMRNEWKVLSLSDVVLNHTANETAWLATHPEATYNARNCPRLRPAALLDAAVAALAPREPAVLADAAALSAARARLVAAVAALRLHECYTCDVERIVAAFVRLARNKVPAPDAATTAPDESALQLQQDPQYRRLASTVDLDLALRIYNQYIGECPEPETRAARCGARLRGALETLNRRRHDELDAHLRAAVDNIIAGASYERLADDGPKIREYSVKHPLVTKYFTYPAGALESAAAAEAVIWGEAGALVAAHNGWVMDGDPLADFTLTDVYLRRELVAWGDSVKLRYGSCPEDSPFLWAHMREYVELTAELFDGVRLDNCHSTPLHVAEYMMDCARNVKPDLYVVAELFTSSELVDNMFYNRLGITALVRESMSASSSHELGRLVHRFGGRAAGALLAGGAGGAGGGAGGLRARRAGAVLYDATHDNASPLSARGVPDVLATAALLALAPAAAASTRTLDELTPHQVHVVDESRLYCAWGGDRGEQRGGGAGGGGGGGCGEETPSVGRETGIVEARRLLNTLHQALAHHGYDEVYVDQMDDAVIAITRHNPKTRESVVGVMCTSFSAPALGAGGLPAPHRPPRPLRLPAAPATAAPPLAADTLAVLLDLQMTQRDPHATFVRHPQVINGLTGWSVTSNTAREVDRCDAFSSVRLEAGHLVLEWGALRPGRAVVLRAAPPAPAAAALARLHAALAAPLATASPDLDLDLVQLNELLYRCEPEERAATGGSAGVYTVPNGAPLVYAGLQGVVSVLDEMEAADDLGHPLADNMREGDWLVEYVLARTEKVSPALSARWAAELRAVRSLARYLQPAYCAALLRRAHAELAAAAARRLRAARGSLGAALALCSVQLLGAAPPARLPAPPHQPTLSAGLPHFAAGYMRCWGRDTFIALNGLLLLTGRVEEAIAHIVGYGACVQHGLVPNLLDGGNNARYNCRDAAWWWARAVQQTAAAAGPALLRRAVPLPAGGQRPLHAVLQDIMDSHFQGIVFRERNAGRQIDAHMTDRGFTVQAGVDPDTGFVFGGNDANCGTWMDKMGSSEAAGNRGRPATPRDGSAIELVALCYATCSWLDDMARAGHYPHAGVSRVHRDGSRSTWTWAQWAQKIKDNFERHFWIPEVPSATDARPDLVHRRGIYKDVHGASQPWSDYQLRCNYAVAMCVAPDLFDPKHAWTALDRAEELLLGPLGMKTLDPDDWAYRGDYDNADASHGFNYHNGPEWLWPAGAYWRARLRLAARRGAGRRWAGRARAALGRLQAVLGPWRGLPELTNADGRPCAHSCPTQAWSSALFNEVLHDLEHMESSQSGPTSD